MSLLLSIACAELERDSGALALYPLVIDTRCPESGGAASIAVPADPPASYQLLRITDTGTYTDATDTLGQIRPGEPVDLDCAGQPGVTYRLAWVAL